MSGYRPWRDVRGRLLIVVLAAVVVAIAATIFGFNRLLTASSTRDANELVRGRAESALAGIRVVSGEVRLREPRADAELDGRIWVFTGRRELEHPHAKRAVNLAAQQLAGGRSRFRDGPGDNTRLFALPIVSEGVRRGTVVAGISLKPYEQTEATALRASILLGAVLLVVVGLASWWLLAAARRPVERMTEQAAMWSERELDRRFNLGPPHDELTRLGATLDGLLDRLAASLHHERRFSAELSHELRTPLARIIAEAELALLRERKTPEYRDALGDVLEERSPGDPDHRRARRGRTERSRPGLRHCRRLRGRTERRGALRAACGAVAGDD